MPPVDEKDIHRIAREAGEAAARADEKLPDEIDWSPGFPLRDKILIACLLVGLAIVVLFATLAPAKAHGHYGWIMDNAIVNPVTKEWCCSEDDCFFMPAYDVTRDRKGYLFTLHGRILRFPASQVLPTRDKQNRAVACIDLETGKPRCLFVPMGA